MTRKIFHSDLHFSIPKLGVRFQGFFPIFPFFCWPDSCTGSLATENGHHGHLAPIIPRRDAYLSATGVKTWLYLALLTDRRRDLPVSNTWPGTFYCCFPRNKPFLLRFSCSFPFFFFWCSRDSAKYLIRCLTFYGKIKNPFPSFAINVTVKCEIMCFFPHQHLIKFCKIYTASTHHRN